MTWRRDQEGFTLVEMLIVMVILGVVTAVTTSAIITMSRSDQFTEEVRQVTDEGRVSMDRARKELRGGRRVLAGSTASHLYWWVDQNQNGEPEPAERVHYCAAPLDADTCVAPTAGTGEYRLIRYTDDSGTDYRTLAATLRQPAVFSGYASDLTETRTVSLRFVLDVRQDGRGPDQIELSGSVRLRNVE